MVRSMRKCISGRTHLSRREPMADEPGSRGRRWLVIVVCSLRPGLLLLLQLLLTVACFL